MKLPTLSATLLTLATASTTLAQHGGMTTKTGFVMHNAATAETQETYDKYQQKIGMVPNLAKVMANSPALLNSYMDTQENLQQQGGLSPAEINIAQMAIAVENECTYCMAGHTMVGRGFLKTPEEHMQAVCKRQPISDPKLRELQRFAVSVYGSRGQVSDERMQAFLDAGYTRGQALDVVACVAAKVMSNYTNALAKTELDAPMKPIAANLGLSMQE
ncbi:Carboxymuconolactone decarboxylase family protein [Planctomycetes bacterium MalM25]|nr:Carboxymuconolactone decarboxylase family protein [Planctomycetes bacterium MalM25]